MFLWNIAVTSLAEVWIEIGNREESLPSAFVTSLAEVWIEIPFYARRHQFLQSLPSRKCGLKLEKERKI